MKKMNLKFFRDTFENSSKGFDEVFCLVMEIEVHLCDMLCSVISTYLSMYYIVDVYVCRRDNLFCKSSVALDRNL